MERCPFSHFVTETLSPGVCSLPPQIIGCGCPNGVGEKKWDSLARTKNLQCLQKIILSLAVTRTFSCAMFGSLFCFQKGSKIEMKGVKERAHDTIF